MTKPRWHKYRAIPTEVDGLRFSSKLEARRYQELQLRERAGEIRGLTLWPAFDLVVNGVKVCRYIADFRYEEKVGGRWVDRVADAKGFRTPVFKLKKKLMLAIFDIEVVEL